jgi:hypothetical protein
MLESHDRPQGATGHIMCDTDLGRPAPRVDLTDGCLLTIRSIQRNLNDHRTVIDEVVDLALTIVHAVEFSRIGRTSPTDPPTGDLRRLVRHPPACRPSRGRSAVPGQTPGFSPRHLLHPTYSIRDSFPAAFGPVGFSAFQRRSPGQQYMPFGVVASPSVSRTDPPRPEASCSGSRSAWLRGSRLLHVE